MNGWKALGFESYQEYLRSDIWLQKQSAMLKLEPRCQECRNADATQVHHLNYDNVGNERKSDLRALCHKCHQKLHGKGKKDGRCKP